MRNIFKTKRKNQFVEPYEIFLDAKNLPKFDTQQFEGRIEHTIPKFSVKLVGFFALTMFTFFSLRLGVLQIAHGSTYMQQSKNNSLDAEPLFADRGIIFDRNNVELAWNDKNIEGEPFARRSYIGDSGFGHLLGYVSYPTRDSAGFYWRSEFIGKDGVEKMYDSLLRGTNGKRIIERDVSGTVTSENITNAPRPGDNITLTIDARVQKEFYTELARVAEGGNYGGAAAAMMDIHTGELIAITSFPEYSPDVLSLGDDREVITGYIEDAKKPFLNRAVAALLAPGSTLKPFMGIAALSEGVIGEYTKILSQNSISIPNPYNPDKPSIFRDFAPNNGWVDLRNALKVSSNIYFYEVGGGYRDQKGIGIANIEKYARDFGLGDLTAIDLPGEKAGVIPSPEWKEKNFPGDPWRIGDTYHTVIGQYGFQVTPIELLRAISAIANGGTLVTPHVYRDGTFSKSELQIDPHNFEVVREGMHLVATVGTARSMASLPFSLGIKTGTAEVGIKKTAINSWMVGFFPYEAPRYAFVIMLERGPADVETNTRAVALTTFQKLYTQAPEYFK